MLGYDEVQSILREREAVDVNCEFCNRGYRFDAVDAEQVFAVEHPAPATATRH
jgi:molecular chaperone Hsp33